MNEIEQRGQFAMHPGWVMCGVYNNDPRYPCRLIASDHLTMAELTYKAEFVPYEIGMVYSPIMTKRELSLTTFMTDMIIIDGLTWQHCFDELFRNRKWEPGPPKAIEA